MAFLSDYSPHLISAVKHIHFTRLINRVLALFETIPGLPVLPLDVKKMQQLQRS
jgi:hypothetical protein